MHLRERESSKYIVYPPWSALSHQKKEMWEISKYVEIEKHTPPKKLMGQRRNQKTLENNENENTMYQNAQDALKLVLKNKFIAVNY